MNILLITPISPFDCSSGGGIRTNLLHNALCQCGEVYTSVIQTWHLPPVGVDEAESRKVRYVEDFQCLPRSTILRWLCEIICVISRKFDRWIFPTDEKLVEKLGWKDEKFDLVVTRFVWPAVRTAAWNIAPLVIDIDDLPTEDFNTLTRPRLPWLKGLILYHECRLFTQNAIVRRAASSWLPNKNQIDLVANLVSCHYLPNIVKRVEADYDVGIKVKRQLLTVGSLNYNANVEGIDWFLENVWKEFHKVLPDVEYVVVGKGLPDAMKDRWLKVPGVRLAGFVENLHDVYAESLAVVAPVFVGGGTAIKTIEAIAHGKKIFATPFAVRGLNEAQLQQAGISIFTECRDFLSAFRLFDAERVECRERDKRMRMEIVAHDYSQRAFDVQVAATISELKLAGGGG